MTSIPKKVQISRILEAVQGVQLTTTVLYDQFGFHTRQRVLTVLNRKVPMVTTIEMKQEQVRSNLEGGSYKNGMKIDQLVQLAERALQTACSVQLARAASWTVEPNSWMIEPYSCFVISTLRIRLSKDSSNLSLRAYRMNPFHNSCETQFRFSRYIYFLTIISFLKIDIFLRTFRH